ncbi:unnamed protein product [Adineta steineri]|uniref:Uncharacterized protein n=1 Tax=Adineta steineri TaxID=433720 RepID=A0A814HZZ5_9BILA|nr:unnamed protein product [Adineta steineri]CAF1267341.1 unnamed protein product [Adineta steineri]CAF1406931.1 unnamed protein product [Adineta steineri]CAF1616338.1 unnamed protein product [Adineta steineri]
MKFIFICLILIIAAVKEGDGIHAHAEMYLAGTNVFIGTINLYEEEEDWGVIMTGFVNRLRPLAVLVSIYFEE